MNNIFSFSKYCLLEKSLNKVDFNEIATKEYLELQDQKSMLNAYVIDYMYEKDGEILDPDENLSDIINSEDFKKWLIYELEVKFEDFYYDILTNYIDSNGFIKLYRAMLVDDLYLEKLKNGQIKRIGHYWTYDFDSAEPHWGYNNEDQQNKIVFETYINEKYINWIETFRLNLEHHYYNEEKEIRLFKNTPLNITNIWWNDQQLSNETINTIKLNNFKA